MSSEEDAALDRLLDRTSRSALAALGGGIDVEQRLRDLHRQVHDPGPVDGDERPHHGGP
jgi:hypothetical protein